MSSNYFPATRLVLAQPPTPEEFAQAASLDVPVLVSAANPSERSTYARLLHALSNRRMQPYVEVQCGGRDPRTRPRPVTIAALRTSFVRADRGTLYLDDIDALDVIRQTWLCSTSPRNCSPVACALSADQTDLSPRVSPMAASSRTLSTG